MVSMVFLSGGCFFLKALFLCYHVHILYKSEGQETPMSSFPLQSSDSSSNDLTSIDIKKKRKKKAHTGKRKRKSRPVTLATLETDTVGPQVQGHMGHRVNLKPAWVTQNLSQRVTRDRDASSALVFASLL